MPRFAKSPANAPSLTMRSASLLRYPGGKWRVAPFFERLIAINGLSGCEYVEPYAGGGSLAMSLLATGAVVRIHLNDLDPAIHAFWWALLRRTDEFVSQIRSVPLSVKEWRRQRLIYDAGLASGRFALGFATFYLNRTNHSGILNAGPIGGISQSGAWKIGARFNRDNLEARANFIAAHKKRIRISSLDAIRFLESREFGVGTLVYLDPPYFAHGTTLYLNAYSPGDHAAVAESIVHLRCPWVVSYDDVPQIRRLYRGSASRRFDLLHTARTTHVGHEVLFFSDKLSIPRLRMRIR